MNQSKLRPFALATMMLGFFGAGMASTTATANDPPWVNQASGLYYVEPDPDVMFPNTTVNPGLYQSKVAGGALFTCMRFDDNGQSNLYNVVLLASDEQVEIDPVLGAQWVMTFNASTPFFVSPTPLNFNSCGSVRSVEGTNVLEGVVEIVDMGDLNGTYHFTMTESDLFGPTGLFIWFTLKQRDLIRLPGRDTATVEFSYSNDADFRGQTSSFAINQKPVQVTLNLPVCAASLDWREGSKPLSIPLTTSSGVFSTAVAFSYTSASMVSVDLSNAGIGTHEISFGCSTSTSEGNYTAAPLTRKFEITASVNDEPM